MKFICRTFFCLLIMCLAMPAFPQSGVDVTSSRSGAAVIPPRFDGVIKTKVEMSTVDGAVRFNIRNMRLGVSGGFGEYFSYRAMADLSNEGALSALDLYVTVKPVRSLSLYLGQTNIPFDNTYIISPGEMMFANRAFVGKFLTPGSRDIGAVAQYRFSLGNLPMEGQAGIFNGGKINSPQWTRHPSYAFRLIAGSMDGFRSTAKVYKYTAEQSEMFLWGADIHYANTRLRVEAEAMNRYSCATDQSLFGTYIQGSYAFILPGGTIFHRITPATRWDAMGYDVHKGFDVNRITVGMNFGLVFVPYDSVLRIDYEQYFLRRNLTFPDFDNQDPHLADNKVTVELVVRF